MFERNLCNKINNIWGCIFIYHAFSNKCTLNIRIYIYNIISTDNIDIPITHSMIKIITDVQHVKPLTYFYISKACRCITFASGSNKTGNNVQQSNL